MPVQAIKFDLVGERHPRPSKLLSWMASRRTQLTLCRVVRVSQTSCGDGRVGQNWEGRLTWGRSVWNFASAHSLVIVTANVPDGPGQRVDIEIIDGSEKGNVYLSKRVSATAGHKQLYKGSLQILTRALERLPRTGRGMTVLNKVDSC